MMGETYAALRRIGRGTPSCRKCRLSANIGSRERPATTFLPLLWQARVGTANRPAMAVLLACDAVVEALVVDVPRDGTDGWMPLFVVLRDRATLDEDLEREIRRRIREDCSPRHVPDEIRVVPEIPRTLSGKILEVPVKRILMGESPDKVASPDSLANPAALDTFVEFARREQPNEDVPTTIIKR